MGVRIKFCGMRSDDDIRVAVAAGADAIGFLTGLTHKSEDRLDPVDARHLIRRASPFLTTVLVTHLVDPRDVADLFRFVGAHAIQIHSDMSAEGVAWLRGHLPLVQMIKAIHVLDGSSADDVISQAQSFEPYVDGLLLDSRTVDRLGGTGQTHDWRVSGIVREAVGKPLVLAGGLKPENVGAAIRQVQPYAVDVNSGVENEAGDKDMARCEQFVAQARGTGTGQSR